MNKKKAILIILISILTIIFIALRSNIIIKTQTQGKGLQANKTNIQSTEQALQAIKDVAFAFYYRGENLQYDNYNMTYQTYDKRKRRSKLSISPEDATNQEIKFQVCSCYIYNIFYEAFENTEGERYTLKISSIDITNLGNPEHKYYNPNIAVDHISENNEGDITAKIDEYKQRILEKIQPGDVIAYRSHVAIYLGDNIVLHSVSNNNNSRMGYDYLNKSEVIRDNGEGTIKKITLDDLLTKNKLFKNSTTQISILRPLNEIVSNYRITEQTLARMEHNKLVREKVASIGKYDSVNPGDEITYTITLENKSDSENYNNIIVTDSIPQYTEFVKLTGNGSNLNGNIRWEVDIPKGEKISISYTIKVKNDKSILGKKVVNDLTVVDGVVLNKIENPIKNTLTKEEQDEISKIALREGESITTSQKFINSVYPEFEFPITNTLLNVFFDQSKTVNLDNLTTKSNPIEQNGDTGKKTIFKLRNNIDEKYKKFADMYIEGLFGGIYTITEDDTKFLYDGRNDRYTSDTFTIGDILIVYDDDYTSDSAYIEGLTNMYLYIDTNTFATVDREADKLIIIKEENGAKLIESLLGQNCFIALRPSYSMEEKLEKVEVETEPAKLLYYVGDTLDTTGLALIGTNNNGSTFEITEGFACNPITLNTAGTQTITVTYEGKTTTFTVEVQEIALDKIEVKTNPTKTTYYVGDTVNIAGLALTGTNNNGSTFEITKDFTYSPTTLNTEGTQTITVTYEGKTTIFTVEVQAITLDKIEVKTNPTKTTYYVGDTVNIAGLVLTGTNNNGSTFEITKDFTYSPTTLNTAGTQTITVTYEGKTTTFTVEVQAIALDKIEVKTKPTKTTYYVGDIVNAEGLVLTGINNNGSTFEITKDFTYSPTTLNIAGTQTITVTYEGKTTTFTVEVQSITLDKIEVKTKPTKTTYYVGDTLNTAGLVLTETNNNGSTFEIISGFTCRPTTLNTEGTQTITVTYEGKATTFTVEVQAIELEKIEVKTKPTKTTYYVGDKLNTAGLKLTGINNNESTFEITKDFTYTPTTLNTAGTQTVTVTYGGKTTTFTVEVQEILLEKIEVKANPTKTTYYVGDTLNTAGLLLTGTNNNGSTFDITGGYTYTPEQLKEIGDQIITVMYKGKEATFEVNVKKKNEETVDKEESNDGVNDNQNNSNDYKDDTISKEEIPNAGKVKILPYIVIILVIASIVVLKRYKQLKNI